MKKVVGIYIGINIIFGVFILRTDMKNYKAEITKIISKSPAVMSEDYNLIDEMAVKILSLIREIVQEAKGQDRHNTTISDSFYDRGIEEGYNIRGSEILSNVEEMIK